MSAVFSSEAAWPPGPGRMFSVFKFWLIFGDPGTITGREPEKKNRRDGRLHESLHGRTFIGTTKGYTKVYKGRTSLL